MASNFRTCPQCSTRNRLDKEFCVKCGEPLEGVKAADAPAPKKGRPGFLISEGGDEAQSLFVPLVFLILTIGVVFAAWRTLQDTNAATPTATAPPPLVQPSLPAVVAVQMAPGVQAYTAGTAALRAQDFPAAIRFLREAVAAANKPDYRLALAEALEKSGSITEALAEYEAAAGLDTANARYTGEWAKALNRQGHNTEAIRVYQAALQIDADNLANLRELTSLQMRANDFATAQPHLAKIVQLQPDDMAAKQNLGRALEAGRDLEGAAKQYRDVVSAMPSADITRALLSDVLMKQSRPDDALQLLDEGIKVDANSAIMYREKGRILDRLGRKADAVIAYQEYVRLAPGASDLRAFTARIEQLTAMAEQ